MNTLSAADMQNLQQELHDAYLDDWGPLEPETAPACLLWTVGELGEVIDIIKKEGVDAVLSDPETHARFAEEVSDVLMHLTDALLCLKVTPDEISESFRAKQKRNLERWK